MKARDVLVYGLIDPRTNEVRYIGKSIYGLKRARAHGQPSRLDRYPGHRANWIRSLQREGLSFCCVVLCRCSEDQLDAAEIFWIAEGRRLGWTLTNATDGGEGAPGCIQSEETKRKVGAFHAGRPKSAEHRARIAEALRGQKHTPERVAKIAAARKPTVLSPEHKERLRQRNLGNNWNAGKKLSAETRAKMSAAHVGQQQTPEQRKATSARQLGVPRSNFTKAKIALSRRKQMGLL